MYTNCQSLQSKIQELTALTIERKPDLILLTETWCNNNVNNASLAIQGYSIETDLRRDRTDTGNGIGGGLLVYSKDGVKVLSCDRYSVNNFNQFCCFKLLTSGVPLTVVLVYRPPSAGPTNTDMLCDIVKNSGPDTLIVGDFNLPGIDWEMETADARGRELLKAAQEENFSQLVSFPTHTKGNVLDLVLTNCPERIVSVEDIGRLGRSDHVIMEIVGMVGASKSQEDKRTLNWKKADWDTMREELRLTNWRKEIASRSVHESWDLLTGKLTGMVERNVPLCKQRSRQRPVWLTDEIMRLIRLKRRKWRVFKQQRTAVSEEEYKKVEKEVAKKIRNGKRRMEKELAFGQDRNKRNFNRYVKSKTKSRVTVGPLKTADGRMVDSDKDMADVLNSFFKSVFTKEDISNVPKLGKETELQLSRITITEDAVRRKIQELRKNAAAGTDGITPMLLKEMKEYIVEPLTLIFRKSLEGGVLPTDWKVANVVPIFKKGVKGDPSNYRPVSLTSIPGKMLESIIKENIMSHLVENRLLRNTQHGFLTGKSCTTNLLVFQEHVTKAVDEGRPMDIIFLDFSKAFDMVPRERLLAKLESKGISGTVLSWLREWLTGRKQRVVIGEEKSDWEDVDSGVPQGSVMGPCAFDVFIDDLEEEITRIDPEIILLKFADDSKLARDVSSEDDRRKLQDALDKLCEWASKWGMSFNVKKCKVMHIGHANKKGDYTMEGQTLGKTTEEKDIGVLVTGDLKPSNHCAKAANMATSVLRQIQKNFTYRDRFTFVKLYIQYVRPHLEFASPAWSPWQEGDKSVLEKVQEKALKMVSGIKAKSYEERCKELGLDTLEKRRNIQDMVETFRILCSNNDGYASGILETVRTTGARTRQAAEPLNLVHKYARTEVRRNSFSVRVAEPWNKLSRETREAKNVQQFKRLLKKEWK